MAAITFCHDYFRKQTVSQLLILPLCQLTPQRWLKPDTVVVNKGEKLQKLFFCDEKSKKLSIVSHTVVLVLLVKNV